MTVTFIFQGQQCNNTIIDNMNLFQGHVYSSQREQLSSQNNGSLTNHYTTYTKKNKNKNKNKKKETNKQKQKQNKAKQNKTQNIKQNNSKKNM